MYQQLKKNQYVSHKNYARFKFHLLHKFLKHFIRSLLKIFNELNYEHTPMKPNISFTQF